MAKYAKFFSVGGGAGPNGLQLPLGTVLDATLRQVQDGTGTGSPLYLSTGSVRIGTTAASAMYWDNTNNRLGIGTSSPISKLQVNGTILSGDGSGDTYSSLGSALGNYGGVGSNYYTIGGTYYRTYNDSVSQLYFNGGGFQFRNAVGGIGANSVIGFNSQMEVGVGGGGYLTLGTNVSGTINGAKFGILSSGSTSATKAMLILNSSYDQIFQIQDDGSSTFGRGGSNSLASFYGLTGLQCVIGNDSIQTPSNIYRTTNGQLTFYGRNNNANAFSFEHNNQQASNSTGISMINLGGGYENQSSFEFANLRISPTYNFNSNTTTNAIARGIYYNPTITNLRLAQHNAIETVTGDVLFGTTSGKVGIGTTNPAFKTQISSSGTSTSISTIASSNYNLVVQNTTDVAGTYSGIGFMNPYDTQGYIGVSQITTGFGAGGNMLFALRPSLGGAVMTEYMRLLHNGNLLIGTTTDNGFKLNVNGSINISGGNKLNFNNGSSQCWITTAGGGTGPSSRSILLPGSGGGGDFIFYNDGPYGIRITESGGDTLVMSPGNSSVTGIMSINKSAASGYGGGTFIYYQSVFGNRMYTFGNPNNERGDEGGSHAKIAGGAAGFLGNGGHVYLEAGAKGTQVGSVDGNIIIAATRGNVAIGTSSPTAKTHIVGTGSTSATTSLLVQNSSGNNALIVTDDKKTRFAGICSVTPDTITGGTLFFQVKSGNWPTSLIEGYENGSLGIGSPTGTLGVGSTSLYFRGTFNPDTTGGWGPQNLINQFAFNYSANFTNAGAGGTSEASLIQTTGNTATTVGDVTLNQFAVKNTINNTGGTTTNRGFYYAPTLTSITNTTNIAFQSTSGSVNINTSTIQASAILQADSTTQGFLPPRVTTVQKNAIATPAAGLMVYDTNLARPCFYNGTTWTTL